MIKILNFSNSISSELVAEAHKACLQVLQNKQLGFHQLPQRLQLWQDIQKKAQVIPANIQDMVIVGIGGSGLGPRALYEISSEPWSPTQKGRKLHFCDNVDPIEFARLWKNLRSLENTIWVFISKSGSTIETLVSADLILASYQEKKLKMQAMVISENVKNPLTDWAQGQQIPTLEIPVDVGGRFSVLTAVGMLPMAFLGQNPEEYRKGAEQAVKSTSLIAEASAHFVQSFGRQEWITFFWFYSSLYQSFGRWLQQLWAESLGKDVSRKGAAALRVSTPMWAIGSSDQHSLLQQVMEGAKDKFVTFTRIRSLEESGDKVANTAFPAQNFFNGHSMGQLIAAQAQGTCQALNEQKVSTMTLEIDDLNPHSLGFQMMFWQLVVATIGEMLDLNAFNQPGVELGKRLAKQILKS